MIDSVVYNVDTMLIPRCKNLNCIRKHTSHKINVLIFLFFFLPVLKNWLLIDLFFLSFSYLLSNNGPSKGMSQPQLLLPTREYITGFTSRHHLGNGRAALCSVQRRAGCFAEKWKRHCPSPKSSQSVVYGRNSTQVEADWRGLRLAIVSLGCTALGTGVEGSVQFGAQLVGPRPGTLFPDLC